MQQTNNTQGNLFKWCGCIDIASNTEEVSGKYQEVQKALAEKKTSPIRRQSSNTNNTDTGRKCGIGIFFEMVPGGALIVTSIVYGGGSCA